MARVILRAVDLGLQFRGQGFPVMLGGFHVSGSLAMLPAMPREMQQAMEDGMTLVAGEVESHWGELLRAACNGALQPL